MHEDSEDVPLDEVELLLTSILVELEKGVPLEELLADQPRHLRAVLRRRVQHLESFPVPAAASGMLSISGYRIIEKLGQGGMAQVWLAHRRSDNKKCALKTLRRDVATAAMIRRFRRESKVLASLKHPGIVKVEDAGESEDYCFIAMEYLEGRPLSELLKGRDLQVSQVLEWLRDIAEALSFVHTRNVVHRDIKPSNIIITSNGRAVLIDFGLTGGVDRTSLSTTGQFVGSPHYAAPEQVRGQRNDIGPASDVYALGATLYECLAGRPPFEATSIQALFRKILLDEPAPLLSHNASIPSDLSIVAARALEKDPNDRYQDAGSLADDLSAVLEGRPVAARSPRLTRRWLRYLARRPTLATALVVAAVAVLAFLIIGEIRARQEEADRSRRAVALVEQAKRLLEELERDAAELPRQRQEFDYLQADFFASVSSPSQRRRLELLERKVETAEAGMEQVSLEILETLRSAEDLGMDRRRSNSLRARLYLQRWRMAEGRGDDRLMAFFRKRILSLDDVEEGFVEQVEAKTIVSFSVVPQGARVDAFVLRRCNEVSDSIDPRFVALPLRGKESGREPGAFVLRVIRSAGSLVVPEDLILRHDGEMVDRGVFVLESSHGQISPKTRLIAVDQIPVKDVDHAEQLLSRPDSHVLSLRSGGSAWDVTFNEAGNLRLGDVRSRLERFGGRVTAWRNGREFEVELPPGAVLRPTRSPLWHGSLSHVGSAPIKDVVLPGNPVNMLIRAPGFLPLRVPVRSYGEPLELGTFKLWREGSLPKSFVPIIDACYRPLVIMDREVTVGEYFAYLCDMHDRGESWEHLIPHSRGGWLTSSGKPKLPSGWQRNWPIHHITWIQAQSYANWRTRKARERGKPWKFSLPQSQRWRDASSWYLPHWKFSWGDKFRPTFCKSCFSRSTPRMEAVLRFPVDENIRGLYDLAGGVSEWGQDWFWQERQQKAVHGGSWVHAEPRVFGGRWTWGMKEDEAREFVGMRLVLLIRDG